MNQLHFIIGEKGGVGKSMWCMALLEYLILTMVKYIFYDADRTSPDVGLVFEPEKYDEIIAHAGRAKGVSTPTGQTQDLKKPTTGDYNYAADNVAVATLEPNMSESPPGILAHIYFSEDEEDVFKVDRILEEAVSGNLVVVNLPAQVEVIITRWLKQRDILESLEGDSSTKMYFWFVTDGTIESLDLLEHSINTFTKPISHILVCNLGLNKRAREGLALHGVAKRIKELKIPVIDMPELIFSKPEMRCFKESRLRLAELADRTKRHPQFALLDRILVKQRAKTFLDKCFDAISSTEVFAPILAMMELEKEKAASAKKHRRTKNKALPDTVAESSTIPDVHSANEVNGHTVTESNKENGIRSLLVSAEPVPLSAQQLMEEVKISNDDF
ncbi:hypothetical protein [Gloeothece verrucosa]|uniref:CobQ/CobB/MinD/ParA nucleotide binding domain-containing protein n=1 Tax=Gloeothece verrucosa (strain PCC 7822) TaxID=497965 RepID=E0UNR1_GLOV7|nr:hypothetical protein [Gloeothece verrucosa]ADN18591.1 hypothetical protein Cyan7822_6953 [Gloeothece verrucosa PCC 7822]